MKRDEYIEKYYKSAFEYEEQVIRGEQVACEWIKLAIKRRREYIEGKYFYSAEAVKRVFGFMYYINISHKGKKIPFMPMGWQAWVMMNLFGYYRDAELTKRLYRFAQIWIGRKNSKTTFAAIMALYAFMKEERSPEAYIVATTKDQASQALRYLKQIVKDSPALNKRIRIMQYQLRHTINGTGYCRALANEPDKLDGLSPSFAIVDEKHEMPTNDLFNVMKTGTLARENPLIVTISTAGFHKDYPFYNEIEIGKSVLRGEVADDSTFYAYYTLDHEEEIDQPEMWGKANPSLGVIMTLEDMKIDFEKASLVLTDKINFMVKNLNVFSDSETTWIPDSVYKRVFKPVEYKDLAGKGYKCYLGLDLSSTRDLSSLVMVVDDESGKLKVIPYFFFPTEENEGNKIRQSGIDLTAWIDKGYIIGHPQKIIDYDNIYELIRQINEDFEIINVVYDKWNAAGLMSRIEGNLLVDLLPAPQNTVFFNFPLKLLERMIYSEEIILSRNPVLRWNFRNIVLYTDSNGNIKIMKNKSNDSVDGAVALAMAVGGYGKANYDSVSEILEEYSERMKE